MKMLPGKQFENYYWMEGPLENDRGCRITVLHNGQLQQCNHCLRRKDSCPGGGVGKLCEQKGTPKGMISDYMKHLKLHHNYSSLKMKYQQDEFPLLANPRQLVDGFGHMVEKMEDEEELVRVGDEEKSQLQSKNIQIAELEAQLSNQNQLRQQLTEAKARLEQFKRDKFTKTCDLPGDFFEYNEERDEVKAVDEVVFDKFIDQKCVARQNRDTRKSEMKNKILEQIKHTERRNRGLSVASFAFSETSARIRPRSDESDGGGESKHNKVLPKIPA